MSLKQNTDRFLRLRAVIELTGLSRSAIYAYVAAGTFPKSISLGQNAVAWSENEIRQWQADRLAARDQKAA